MTKLGINRTINKEAEELIIRKDLKNTPFQIISIVEENKHFAVMGKYRITENYDKVTKCENEVTKITWNRLIQIIMLLHEYNNNPTQKN